MSAQIIFPAPFHSTDVTVETVDDVTLGAVLAGQEELAAEPEARYHGAMNTPTREEIDAKIETIEARMDGRVAAIQASVEGYMGRMEERALRTDERFVRIEDGLKETQASISSLKSTTIVTAISSVLAIVLGVAAFNATVLSNMVASFESGKNTAASQADVKRQAEETAALLKQIQQQLAEGKRETTSPNKSQK